MSLYRCNSATIYSLWRVLPGTLLADHWFPWLPLHAVVDRDRTKLSHLPTCSPTFVHMPVRPIYRSLTVSCQSETPTGHFTTNTICHRVTWGSLGSKRATFLRLNPYLLCHRLTTLSQGAVSVSYRRLQRSENFLPKVHFLVWKLFSSFIFSFGYQNKQIHVPKDIPVESYSENIFLSIRPEISSTHMYIFMTEYLLSEWQYKW